MERQLLTYETIIDLQPIEGADQIELASVRGWNAVVRKGEFKVGDSVVYAEIDSALPLDDPRFTFLEPRGVKVIDGKNYHVLRTIRLRGQISQGLILPADQFSDGLPKIQKYEAPVPQSNEPLIGQYPHEWAIKTDAERVQNLAKFMPIINTLSWTATEKIDGTSTTYINDGRRFRIASRNWELDTTPGLLRNKVAEELGIWTKLSEGYAIQGELFGPNIQNNPLKKDKVEFRAFNLFKYGELIPYDQWPDALVALRVPSLDLTLPDTVDSIVAQADRLTSTITPGRQAEGIVWHCGAPLDFLGGRDGFKAINNTYLAKLRD